MMRLYEDDFESLDNIDVFRLPDGTFCRCDGDTFIPVTPKVQAALEKEYRNQQRLKDVEAEGQNVKDVEEWDKLRHQIAANNKDKHRDFKRDKEKQDNMFHSKLSADEKRKSKIMSKSYFHSKNFGALEELMLEILSNVINNEILPSNRNKPEPNILRTKSFQRPDTRHDWGDKVLLKGQVRRHRDPEISKQVKRKQLLSTRPLVLVYIDRSGSFFNEKKIQLVSDVKALLDSKEFQMNADVTYRYFKDEIFLTDQPIIGGTDLTVVLEDIPKVAQDRLCNVIIITDDDSSADFYGNTIPINGSVFLIFATKNPSCLSRNFNLQGDSVLKEFVFEM